MPPLRRVFRQDLWISALLAGVLLSMYMPVYRTGAWVGKEGVCLYGSRLAAEGKIPYRDFDSFYAPFTTYLHALVFTLGGVSIDRARLLLLFALVLNALSIYILSRRLLSPLQAGAIGLLGAAFYRFPPHNYVTLYATLFSLITLIVLAHALETRFTPGGGLWIGLLTGLTSVTHHPIAVFLALSVVGSAAIAPFISSGKGPGYSVRSSVKFIIAFGIGCAVVALPVYGTFASLTSWGELLRQLLPPQVAGEMGRPSPPLADLIPRSLSGTALYPFAISLFFWGTLLLVALTALFLVYEYFRPTGAPLLFLLPLTVFQCLMESKNLALGTPNLLYTQVTFVLAGYWGFRPARGDVPGRPSWRHAVMWGACCALLIFEVGSWATRQFIGRAKPTFRVAAGQSTLFMSPILGRATQELIDFLKKNTPTSEPVAIFPDGALISLFLDRPNPFTTRIIDTDLEGIRDPKIQQSIIDDLDGKGIKTVVIFEWGPGFTLRFDLDKVPVISAYLRDRYTPIRDIGAIQPPLLSFIAHIYKRKS